MRILSGIQPTGLPHLGNYFGMMKAAIEFQKQGEALYFIADLHALTTVRDPESLRHHSREIAIDFLACGLRVQELTGQNIYIGTSSWKYEGWLGQLYSPERYAYRGKVAKSRFEAGCLEEYAEVFKTVCVDAGFYRFPEERYVEKLASQVPDGFKFSFKVTDEITLKNFPNQPRHGSRAGKPNENFLNAELFAKAFLSPLTPYREKVGVLMFEFGHLYKRDFAQVVGPPRTSP